MIEKMESGELPPSPFAGRKSWDIEFPGFDNNSKSNEKGKDSDQDETAIDYIIWALYQGYSLLQPNPGSWKRQIVRIVAVLAILLLVFWVSHRMNAS